MNPRQAFPAAALKSPAVWLLLWAAFGFTLVAYSTPWGAALSDDSYYYIHAARDLAAGQGLTLNAHFPPLLSLVLAIPGVLGVDPLLAVRWLNALLFGVNSFLTGWLVWQLSRSYPGAVLAALLFVTSSHLLEAHAWAMSEPLYIAWMLCGFLCFFIASRSRLIHESTADVRIMEGPVLTGLCFGLAALTRYIGVSLLLAGGLAWLFFPAQAWCLRLKNTLLFAAIGLAPSAVWLLRNIAVTGQLTSRAFAWHPAPIGWWREAINTMTLWLVPGRIVFDREIFWLSVWAAAVLLIAVWAAWQLRHQRSQRQAIAASLYTILLLAGSMVAYGAVLIFSRSFLDPRIPSDTRLLAPVWVITILLIILLAVYLWRSRRRIFQIIALFICLIPLATNAIRSLETVQSYHAQGRGYASARDSVSETYAYLRRYPQTPVYSNAPAAIYFWTGRDTFTIPGAQHVPDMKASLEKNGGFLVIFDSIPLELYQVSREALTDGLIEVIRLSEATIYKHP